LKLGMVACAYNPSYLESINGEDWGQPGKKSVRPHLNQYLEAMTLTCHPNLCGRLIWGGS
jgi:hypothetical protein